jgi:hypothetical protein
MESKSKATEQEIWNKKVDRRIYSIWNRKQRRQEMRYRIEKATGENKIWNRKARRQERRYRIAKATGDGR